LIVPRAYGSMSRFYLLWFRI